MIRGQHKNQRISIGKDQTLLVKLPPWEISILRTLNQSLSDVLKSGSSEIQVVVYLNLCGTLLSACLRSLLTAMPLLSSGRAGTMVTRKMKLLSDLIAVAPLAERLLAPNSNRSNQQGATDAFIEGRSTPLSPSDIAKFKMINNPSWLEPLEVQKVNKLLHPSLYSPKTTDG